MQRRRRAAHPLTGTVAEYVWLLPLLPLLGFVINGALSMLPAFHAGPRDPSHDAAATGHTDMAHADDDVRTATTSSVCAHALQPRVERRRARSCVALAFALSRWRSSSRCAARASVGSSRPFVAARTAAGCRPATCRSTAAFQLDQLSMVMVLVITGVGTLIHSSASATCGTTRGTRATSRT